MTKQELCEELCERTDLTRVQALENIDAITNIITEALNGGDDVILRGFGTFKCVQRAAKKARNIHKGTIINIPARTVVKFVPSINLKPSFEK